MSREILLLVDALASEKNVAESVVFSALEQALASATKKKINDQTLDVRVEIDRTNGDYRCFRRWLIVEEKDFESTDYQIMLTDAKEKDVNAELGNYIEEPMENVEFGRIGAQAAKQVILQKIRDAEREQILNDFLRRKEQLINGTVKRMERGSAIIECGRLEALLPRDQMIPKENLRIGDRIKAFLLRVDRTNRGPQLVLTRISREFLAKLFELEVPEIEEGLLEIKEVARDPGLRSKIAVKSNEARIDPQGTCIGMRGSRVQAVMQELAGERIDIVLWSAETAQYVINALSPAQVNRILIDEENHLIDVIVDEEQLPLAIGRNGQNVRLAAELTGWNLNVMTEEEAEEKHQVEDSLLRSLFIKALGVDEDIADILVKEGFVTLEEVAYVPIEELLDIEGFDDNIVNQLRSMARDAILTQAIVSEEKMASVDDILKNLPGMSTDLVRQLAEQGVVSVDDLADLSVGELIDITGISEKDAGILIMKAREHWDNE